MENVSLCDETLMESYLESGEIDQDAVAELIRERKLFPCYFGSALKMQGVEEFLRGFEEYTREKIYPEEFGAKVFKIARDGQGNRLTYMRSQGKPEGQGQSGLRRRRKSCGQTLPGRRNRQSPGRRRWIRSACIPAENMKLFRKRRQEPSAR